MVESGVFFQYSKFLGEKSLFLGEKVHRAEKKRVDITAENSRAEQN